MEVRIDELDELTWFANFRRGAFEATLITHPPYETPDLPMRLYHSGGINGAANPFGLQTLARCAHRALVAGVRPSGAAAHPVGCAAAGDGDARDAELFTSTGYVSTWDRVHDRGAELQGSLSQYNYAQWLG